MLRMRTSQLQSLVTQRHHEFEQRLLAHALRRFAGIDERAGLAKRLVQGTEQARILGLRSQQDVALFADVSLAFPCLLDENPKPPWIQQHLEEASLAPTLQVQRLCFLAVEALRAQSLNTQARLAVPIAPAAESVVSAEVLEAALMEARSEFSNTAPTEALSVPCTNTLDWLDIRVLDSNGDPVADRSVEILHPSGVPVTRSTDRDGFAGYQGLGGGNFKVSIDDGDGAFISLETGRLHIFVLEPEEEELPFRLHAQLWDRDRHQPISQEACQVTAGDGQQWSLVSDQDGILRGPPINMTALEVGLRGLQLFVPSLPMDEETPYQLLILDLPATKHRNSPPPSQEGLHR